jgi:hypothetical protein
MGKWDTSGEGKRPESAGTDERPYYDTPGKSIFFVDSRFPPGDNGWRNHIPV